MTHMPSPLGAPSPRRPRLPRALSLVREPSPEEVGAPIDWSAWYLTDEDDVGQSPEQDHVVATVGSALEERWRELGRTEWIGRDAFFAWVKDHPLVRVSPDVYTLAVRPPQPLPRSFQTWLPGHTPPVFALEVVSDEWKKDYDDGPQKYALLGAKELVIFDADAARGRTRGKRVALQVFRREEDGSFVQVYRGAGPVFAETIETWLVVRATDDPAWMLRLARDPLGTDPVPTSSERAVSESRRADDEKRRADDEKRRADALAAELDALRRR